MKIGKPTDDKLVITVKQASRDAKTEKMKYTTIKSMDVYDAKPEEVIAAITSGIESASRKPAAAAKA